MAPHVLQDAWTKARVEVVSRTFICTICATFASTLAAGTGASTKELMHRVGHASQQATLRYQDATRERDRAIR